MTKRVLITGGAGFIGCHSADYFRQKGYEVAIIDNLSRLGSAENLKWLKEQPGITHYQADIRDRQAITDIFKEEQNCAGILHLAAQVAVTTSVSSPREDFEVNALGTFNLLEATRQYCPEAPFIFASTNKVYGNLPNLSVVEKSHRYQFEGELGVSEKEPLDFHSPYGCSKGCADQYVIDYARIYGMKTLSLRQSCIYGERQFGVEDQGWVAWFIIAAILDKPIFLYGDGKQVRDVLNIHDLTRLYEEALVGIDKLSGKAYNVGGGADYSLSLLEFIDLLKEENIAINYKMEDWRPGDQKVFVSDNTKLTTDLGWQPKCSPTQGIRELVRWVRSNKTLLNNLLSA